MTIDKYIGIIMISSFFFLFYLYYSDSQFIFIHLPYLLVERRNRNSRLKLNVPTSSTLKRWGIELPSPSSPPSMMISWFNTPFFPTSLPTSPNTNRVGITKTRSGDTEKSESKHSQFDTNKEDRVQAKCLQCGANDSQQRTNKRCPTGDNPAQHTLSSLYSSLILPVSLSIS